MSRLGSTIMGVAAGVAAFVLLEHLERLRTEWSPLATWIGESWRTIVADPSSLLEPTRTNTSPPPPATIDPRRERDASAQSFGSIDDLGSSAAGTSSSDEARPAVVQDSPGPSAVLARSELASIDPGETAASAPLPAVGDPMVVPARWTEGSIQPDPEVLARSAELGAATTRAMELASTMERLGRRLEGRRTPGERR